MDRLCYYVPLRPFERELASELAHILDQQEFRASVGEHPPFTTVFMAWKWASTVKNCLNDDLGEEQLEEEYGGDKSKAYDSFIHAEDIRSANKDFLGQLGDRGISEVEVVPVDEDVGAWKTLSKVYHTFGRHWEHKDPLGNPRGSFDVWQLIRKFVLHWNWPENKVFIDHSLVCSPIFASVYNTVRHPLVTGTGSEDHNVQEMTDGVEKLEIQKRPKETKEASISHGGCAYS
jgi:ribosomal protein S19E (S16A)